jgi:TusA-related sulfurtransferase
MIGDVMKIEKIDVKNAVWSKANSSKYDEIVEAIKNTAEGEAILIELDTPRKYASNDIRQALTKNKIRCVIARQDKEGKKWAIKRVRIGTGKRSKEIWDRLTPEERNKRIKKMLDARKANKAIMSI